MTDEKLIEALREEAQWARANEWETPITLADHLSFAAERIEELTLEIKELQKERTRNSLKEQIMIDQHLREVTKMVPRWVSVNESLPELTENDRYCVKHYGFRYAPEYIVKIANSERTTTLLFEGAEWFDAEGRTYAVTHWMPLPEPPSTEGSPTGQKGERMTSEFYKGYQFAMSIVRNFEKADVVPVRNGRWEWRCTNQYTQILTCTACGKTENATETCKYCPNCGARMDGGADNGKEKAGG